MRYENGQVKLSRRELFQFGGLFGAGVVLVGGAANKNELVELARPFVNQFMYERLMSENNQSNLEPILVDRLPNSVSLGTSVANFHMLDKWENAYHTRPRVANWYVTGYDDIDVIPIYIRRSYEMGIFPMISFRTFDWRHNRGVPTLHAFGRFADKLLEPGLPVGARINYEGNIPHVAFENGIHSPEASKKLWIDQAEIIRSRDKQKRVLLCFNVNVRTHPVTMDPIEWYLPDHPETLDMVTLDLFQGYSQSDFDHAFDSGQGKSVWNLNLGYKEMLSHPIAVCQQKYPGLPIGITESQITREYERGAWMKGLILYALQMKHLNLFMPFEIDQTRREGVNYFTPVDRQEFSTLRAMYEDERFVHLDHIPTTDDVWVTAQQLRAVA